MGNFFTLRTIRKENPKFSSVDTTNEPISREENSPKPPSTPLRSLVPDFDVFCKVDRHAKSALGCSRFSEKELVSYLIRPCTSDLERIRVFYIWICHNIGYDVKRASAVIRPTLKDNQTVIKTGLAVCQEYSILFQSFCRLTDIPVKCIYGHLKGHEYRADRPFTETDKPDHEWNAVKLQGEWRFIDLTLGAGYLKDNKFVRRVSDSYFVMDPKHMINSHFPFMNNDIRNSLKWQLLKSPISLERFNSNVHLSLEGLEWGVKIKPMKAVLVVNKKIKIIIKSNKIDLKDVKAVLVNNGKETNGQLYVEEIRSGVFKTTIRPECTGDYELKFFTTTSYESDMLVRVATMVLKVTNVFRNIYHYPHYNLSYGAKDILKSGLTETMKCGGVLFCRNGNIRVPVETIPGVKLTYSLHHSQHEIEDAGNFVFSEKQSNILTKFHVRLPITGLYEFRIYSQMPEQTGRNFNLAARILIQCRNPSNKGPFPIRFLDAEKMDTKLISPTVRDLQANSRVSFKLSCETLKAVELRIGGDSYPLKNNNNVWCGTVDVPGAGTEMGLWGNVTSNRICGLYKFKSVSS